MAGTVKITDFIRWAMQRIDPAELSVAMTEYGYTDDSAQSVIDALERHPEFSQRFAVLLGEGQAARTLELQRTNQGDDELTLEDWTEIIKRKNVNYATGIQRPSMDDAISNAWTGKSGSSNSSSVGIGDSSSGKSSGGSAKSVDWGAILGGVASVAGVAYSIITGRPISSQDDDSQKQQQSQQSGSMTFVWIIVGVVVVAAIGIIALSVMKKK